MEGIRKLLPVVEIICGIAMTAGIGGLVLWFVNERIQVYQERSAIREELKSYRNIADSYAQKEAERSAHFTRLQTDLTTTHEKHIAEVQATQQELNATLGKLQKSLHEVSVLHEKFKSFEVVESGIDRSKKVILRGAGNVFFQEDFSGYRTGDIPQNWGIGAMVALNDGDLCLSGVSETSGIIKREVDFPRNFSLQVSVYSIMDFQWWLSLVDAQGKEFTVDRRVTRQGFDYFISIKGAQPVDLYDIFKNNVKKKWSRIQVEVRDTTVRLKINGTHIITTQTDWNNDHYANFVRLEMSSHPWNKFSVDNFYGVDLGEEVKPVGGK